MLSFKEIFGITGIVVVTAAAIDIAIDNPIDVAIHSIRITARDLSGFLFQSRFLVSIIAAAF